MHGSCGYHLSRYYFMLRNNHYYFRYLRLFSFISDVAAYAVLYDQLYVRSNVIGCTGLTPLPFFYTLSQWGGTMREEPHGKSLSSHVD